MQVARELLVNLDSATIARQLLYLVWTAAQGRVHQGQPVILKAPGPEGAFLPVSEDDVAIVKDALFALHVVLCCNDPVRGVFFSLPEVKVCLLAMSPECSFGPRVNFGTPTLSQSFPILPFSSVSATCCCCALLDLCAALRH